MAYGTNPFCKRENVAKIRQWGHTMHSLPIGPVYLKMVEYARGREEEEVLLAYIDGLLMHYCVDRLCHPYIFYRSGFDGNGNLTGYYNWSHGAFEALLDKFLAKRKGTYLRLYKAIYVPEIEQVKAVSKMWAAVSPTHLDEDDFLHSYEDFVSAEKLLYTPTGLKRFLFRLMGKYSTPWAQSHPRFAGKFRKLDVENQLKKQWLDPCTGEPTNASVDDLLSQALKDYQDVLLLLQKAREGSDVGKEFDAWTRNLDHEGCPIGVAKTHYDLCWKAMGKKKYLP